MILHLTRMRRNVNRNVYNAGKMYALQYLTHMAGHSTAVIPRRIEIDLHMTPDNSLIACPVLFDARIVDTTDNLVRV